MTDPNDEDNPPIGLDLIEDPVIPDSEPKDLLSPDQLLSSARIGILHQGEDSPVDPLQDFPRQISEIATGRGRDLDPKAALHLE